MKKKPIPPLIEGWIASMNDKSNNIYVRDNYCAMLENVRDQADAAIQQFYKEKNKVLSEKIKKFG